MLHNHYTVWDEPSRSFSRRLSRKLPRASFEAVFVAYETRDSDELNAVFVEVGAKQTMAVVHCAGDADVLKRTWPSSLGWPPVSAVCPLASPQLTASSISSTEARDEKRLLRLQSGLAQLKLLLIDELGYVPLSPTGAELLIEVTSQRYERCSTPVMPVAEVISNSTRRSCPSPQNPEAA